MSIREKIKLINKVCEEIENKKEINTKQLTKLEETFGLRFNKAWETLKEERVKKYIFSPSNRIVWIVIGREREYQIMPAAGFCSCDDFYFRVMDQETDLCYHLIAQKIADSLGRFDKIEEEDRLYDFLMEEWKKVTP